MAGIGFELRRMIDSGQGLAAKIRGYTCAGLISSGPWIMTILTLGVLSGFARLIAAKQEFEVFRGLITYAFAFSLITVGILQMSVTRRVADLLYQKKYDRVLPAFNSCVLWTGLVQFGVGSLFCLVAGLPVGLSALAVSLYVVVSLTWLALIWLGVIREYDQVLKAYGVGSLAIVVIVMAMKKPMSAEGLLASYAAGQAIILVMLVKSILRGLQSEGPRSFEVLRSVKTFPRLMLVGLTYNAAIWVDKMVFWFFDGIGPHPFISFHPLYDTCCFLAYLTVIPALAVNLVRLETTFYECYRGYFGAILGGMPLRVIAERRQDMFDNMHEGMVRLLRIQGAITTLFILFAPWIVTWLGLPPSAARIFRAVCLGALFHVMLLIVVLMQLYFDLRRQALSTCLFFLFANGLLAVWSVDGGLSTYGFGYAIAALLALLAGYTQLTQSMTHLDFYVFTNQPIPRTKAGDAHGSGKKSGEKEEESEEEDAPFPEVDPVFEWIDAYEDEEDEEEAMEWEDAPLPVDDKFAVWPHRRIDDTRSHGPGDDPIVPDSGGETMSEGFGEAP